MSKHLVTKAWRVGKLQWMVSFSLTLVVSIFLLRRRPENPEIFQQGTLTLLTATHHLGTTNLYFILLVSFRYWSVFLRCIILMVLTNVSEESTAPTFNNANKPRKSTSSPSPLWKPQISYWYFLLAWYSTVWKHFYLRPALSSPNILYINIVLDFS